MAQEKLEFLVAANVRGALEGIDRLGNAMKKLGKAATEVGGGLSLMGGVLVREAAKYDTTVKRAVDEVKGAFAKLSIEIGRALVPAVRELSEFISDLVRAWRDLGPELQASVISFGLMTVKIAGVVGIGSKLFDLLGDLAGIAPVLLPLVVIIGVLGTAAAVLYATWKENWGGMRKTVDEFADGVGSAFSSVLSFVGKAAAFFVQIWSKHILQLISVAKAAGNFFGIDALKGTPGSVLGTLEEAAMAGSDVTPDQLWKGITEGAKTSGEVAGKAWSVAFNDAIAALKIKFPELSKALSNFSKTQGNFGSAPITLETAEKNRAKEFKEMLKRHTRELDFIVEKDIEARKKWTTRFAAQMGESLKLAGGTVLSAGMSGEKSGAVLQGASQGMAAGGPWGALMGAAAGLLTKTEEFGALIQQVEAGFTILAKFLGPIIKPLLVLNIAANVLFQVIGPLTESVTFVSRMLFELFKALGTGLLTVLQKIGHMWNKVIDWAVGFIAKLAYTIGDNVIGAAVGELATSINGLRVSTNDIDGALADIQAANWQNVTTQVGGLGPAAESAANAIEDFTEALTNVPTGYKVNAARMAATDADAFGPQGANFTIQITPDAAMLIKEVTVSHKRTSYINSGSTVG